MLSNTVWATRLAHVKTDQAVVYADQNLSTPLGRISRGKKVVVGEVPRKYGTLLPVLIAGRVGWIQIKDIQFVEIADTDSENMLEHDIIALEKSDNLGINNHIGLVHNVLVFGNEWEELSYAIGDEVGLRPFYMTLYFDHRPPSLRYSFGVGLSYLYLEQEHLVLSAPMLELKGLWSAIKYKYFNFNLSLGAFFSGAFKVDSTYNPLDEDYDNTGEMYGINYGVEFKYFPYSTFSLINGLSFQRGIISGLAPIKISYEENDTVALTRFKATNYYFGVSYQF
ncbi:MAG: hypothetical protein A2381_06630 [Bdellovibrionales bacterium RIFOXYB1_FULL_37_110]|nr:MAG: hypothetical protein A2181_08650 [Bdellovibrionales bacterium RIFOXYA1_FULL_38_20]OFZ50217.1 MAG: hypothetical protein A2417_19480 [Bdellovibrionales bacterium RIFOXYC1_FULL_37_79]OFZ57654.1 MAG: hypothetical protein A2381_06630 [Bdellovibrionales bacterium RIFOXYB1_FULL_37_110]OFZ61421.1 MAG: hypothetical protein A2577_00995 [Bdellovibrionales bacterium RIFOXYD1_FULL_36_51]